MLDDLKLPPTEGAVIFYPNSVVLEAALVKEFETQTEEFEKVQLGVEAREALRSRLLAALQPEIDKLLEQQPERARRTMRARLIAEFNAMFDKQFEATRQAFHAKKDENVSLLARQKATTVVALAGRKTVFVNELSLSRYPWNERTKILAHELAHVVEKSIIGSRDLVPGLWLQDRLTDWLEKKVSDARTTTPGLWMEEGFAEWIACKVLDRLGIETFDALRQRALTLMTDAREYQSFPVLGQLVLARDWDVWSRSLGLPATYGQSLLAIDSLVEEKGLPALVEYFQIFGKSNDREQSFTSAFGEPTVVFEAKFDRDLQGLLGK
jgi:hypothetical protein